MAESDLVRRVEALEAGARYDTTKEAVQRVEMEFLAKLREIQQALGEGSTSSKETEALKQENEALKKKNAKQAYRIQHLIQTVQELLSKQS